MNKSILIISIFLIVLSISVYARSMDVNSDNKLNALDVGIINNNLGSNNAIYNLNNDKDVNGLDIVNDLDIGLLNSVLIKCPLLVCDCRDSENKCDADFDNDGVLNDMDKCGNTPQSEINSILREAEYYGCSPCEIDRDRDTIVDCQDECPTEYGLGIDGCPAGIQVMGDDLIIPYGEVVYSSQLKKPNKLGYINYINILILGKLDVAPVAPLTGLKLKAENNFIFYNNGIINANGDINEPGKDVNLEAARLEIEGTEIDINQENIPTEHLDLINKHILREPNDGGITQQCSAGDVLAKECGYCGNRLKTCDELGIWSLDWSSCLGQGYCDPSVPVSDILSVDTHRKIPTIQDCVDNNNKVEYVKTIESKECGSDCSYTNVQEIDKPVALECNAGYCGATCSGSGATNEDCGRCGKLSCDNCKESCSKEGECTPGTRRVSVCSDIGCNYIKYEECVSCKWNQEPGGCKIPGGEDGCNKEEDFGKTKSCGYCGTQTCMVTCPDDPTNAYYYWGGCTGEYTGNDKCIYDAANPEKNNLEPKVIKEKEPACDGKLSYYEDILEGKKCNEQCKIVSTGTTTKRQTPGTLKESKINPLCGYYCDNGQRSSGTGECVQVETCQNNNWVVTTPAPPPKSEICVNGKDDDCDGIPDVDDCTNTIRYIPPTPPTPEKCSGCSCGNYNLDGDRNGKVDSDDFKVFYKLNGKCGLNPEESKADFNGDGCVGIPGTDKSFGGGYATVNNVYSNYPNPDFDCFMERYTPNCDHGCADLDSDGTADTPDLVIALSLLRKCQNTLADMDGNGCMYHIQKDNQIIGDIYCIAAHVAGILDGIGPECPTASLTAVEQDSDGDGHPISADCDDNDNQRYPGAPELCGGKDYNCDTIISKNFKNGDVNKDETINTFDGIAILNLVKIKTSTPQFKAESKPESDVNNDGETDMFDYVCVINLIK